MYIKKGVLLSLILYLLFENTFSQIESKGIIPESYNLSIEEKVESYLDNTDYLRSEKKINNFLLKSAFLEENRIFDANVLYGSDINLYINKIANKIIANIPELKEGEIKFYINKDKDVNAYSFYYGKIFLNIGLISCVEDEGELAFIIAHEIAHYLKKHSVSSYKLYNKTTSSPFAIIRQFLKVSKNHEFEADSLGYVLYNKSEYAKESILSAINKLFNSDQSFIQKKISFSKLFNEDYYLPNSYSFHNEIEIDKKVDYFDKFHTHPNIKKRIDRVLKFYNREKEEQTKKKKFLVSESQFKKISHLARNENLRLLVVKRRYAQAIYLAFHLKELYPENILFYDDVLVKSIFAVSKYKTAERQHEILLPYHNKRGAEQSVNYLIKQLTKKQFNAIAIKYIYEAIQKTKNEEYLSYFKGLIFDFKNINNVSEEDMRTSVPNKTYIDSLNLDVSNYSNLEISNLQMNQSSFYKYLFSEKLKKDVFKESEEKKENRPINILSSELIIFKYDDIPLSILKLEDLKELFYNSNSLDIDFSISKLKESRSLTTRKYNKLSRFNEWCYEVELHKGLFSPLMNKESLCKNNYNNYIQKIIIYYSSIEKKYIFKVKYIEVDSQSQSFSFEKLKKKISSKYILNQINQQISFIKSQQL